MAEKSPESGDPWPELQISNWESQRTKLEYKKSNQLEVLRFEACALGNAGKHFGANFHCVMERPGEFTFAWVLKLNVRGTFLCLDGPPDSEQGARDFAGFCTRPVAQGQQAMEMSRGLSFVSFSISSASTRRARALTLATASCLLLP